MRRVLVPLDLTVEAGRALQPGAGVARRLEVPLTLFGWHPDIGELATIRRHLNGLLAATGLGGDVVARCSEDWSPVPTLLETAARIEGTMICMASHGRTGVGEAVFGSVAEDILRDADAPVMLVGPHCSPQEPAFAGPVVVCLDRSERSEHAIALAKSWAQALDQPVELVSWLESPSTVDEVPWQEGDLVESGYLQSLARTWDVHAWEVLHGSDAARAVAAHAKSRASMLVASTHGRTGLARMVVGSVAARIVHHASCPVVVFRPPGLV